MFCKRKSKIKIYKNNIGNLPEKELRVMIVDDPRSLKKNGSTD